MSARRTLPLGIDVGAVRTRVALAERAPSGRARLIAVAARATEGDAAAAIVSACAELRTRERRCVLGIAAPDALLRAISLPPMPWNERVHAARFEASRFVPYPVRDAVVRIAPLGADRYAVGIARRAALEGALRSAARAGLRAIAVDDGAFALLRAFPDAGAIIDIGGAATRLVLPGTPLPVASTIAIGGAAFTAAIVASLGLDVPAAERRKCTVGLAGAGEHVRDGLVEHLAAALAEHRAANRREITSIVLAGNGARLSGLAEALEAALALPVRLAVLPGVTSATLPADVLRAAAPDWGTAYGLALWADAA